MQRIFWTIPAVIAAGMAIWIGTAHDELGGWFWVLLAITLIFVLLTDLVRDQRPWTSREAYGILLGIIAAANWPQDKVRICVYKPVWWHKNILKQITPYATSGEWRSTIRYQHASKGAVGRAYRTKSNTVAVFKNGDDRIKICVEAFGYTQKEANNLTHDRTGVAAYPVKGENNRVTHVIFFDTCMENISVKDLQGTISRKIQRAARELPRVS